METAEADFDFLSRLRQRATRISDEERARYKLLLLEAAIACFKADAVLANGVMIVEISKNRQGRLKGWIP